MAYKEVANMAENREKDESRRFDLFGDNSTGTGQKPAWRIPNYLR
jgi:hypothetical protein